MEHCSSSRTVNTRGPYKKNPDKLYRSKIRNQDGDTSRDAEPIMEYLKTIREDMKSRFQISYNRSKVIENLQGLIDCINKQVKYQQKIDDSIRIKELEEKVKALEQRLNQDTGIISSEMITQMLQNDSVIF